MRLRILVLATGLMLSAAIVIGQAPQQPYRVGNGVSSPTPIKMVKPNYTPEARERKIEGIVVLDAVVREDGTVDEVTVARSLDSEFGLDAEAVKAGKQWTFKPGMKDGRAVSVLVTLELRFSLPTQ
jgi:TonB family protein